MHNPLLTVDLVGDEIDQRRETGYEVEAIAAQFASTDDADEATHERLLVELQNAPRSSSWNYEEPDDLDGILATLPPSTETAAMGEQLEDRILGGWLGRIAGCNLGKPIENGWVWTPAHIRQYLELANAYPLRDYIPALDPMPEGFAFVHCWPNTTRGRIDGSDRDDDIDYAILGMHLLETFGTAVTTRNIADSWLFFLPYYQVYTAERAAYTNLVRSVPLEDVARTRNPYREWIGALIRGDAFGWINPGRPRAAARLAYVDASLSHVANGIYGEMWSAALVAAAFTSSTATEAFEASLQHIPPRSRLREALDDVQRMYRSGLSWDDGIAEIHQRYGHYSWVHTVNNAAVIAAGLLWGEGDYAATVGLTVQGGWDTDSNGATAGSVAGVLLGGEALPTQFIEPLHDRTGSALFGFDQSRISDLAQRTVVLARAAAESA